MRDLNQISLFKSIICISILLSSGYGTPVLADSVKIMSYNVLARWDESRADRLAAAIRAQDADILGLQEVVGGDLDYLFSAIGDTYDVYFGETADPILIRTGDRLRLVDQGSTELYKCLIDRQVNWVRMEDIESGKEFIYYNTHLCFILRDTLDGITNEEANQLQASTIMDTMEGHAEEGLVQVIGGDLNVFASSNTTRFFIEGVPLPVNGRENPLKLVDSWAVAPGNSGRKPATLGGGGGAGSAGQGQRGGMAMGGNMGPPPQMPDEPGIDWLFVSETADVVAADVIINELTSGPEGASDHLPVSVTINFE